MRFSISHWSIIKFTERAYSSLHLQQVYKNIIRANTYSPYAVQYENKNCEKLIYFAYNIQSRGTLYACLSESCSYKMFIISDALQIYLR